MKNDNLTLAKRIENATDDQLEELKNKLDVLELLYRNRLIQRSSIPHTISDNGEYIKEETLNEIFKLFDSYDKEYFDALKAWNIRNNN